MVKTAIISGGARGIGRCLTRRFCERDCKVFVLDIDEAELTHTVRTHLKAYSERGMLGSRTCDLRDLDDIKRAIDEAAEFLGGRVDVLVNNGGWFPVLDLILPVFFGRGPFLGGGLCSCSCSWFFSGGIASPYWKDDKTMFDAEVMDQWKACVGLSPSDRFFSLTRDQIHRHQPHRPVRRLPRLSAVHERRSRRGQPEHQ
jgi:NAD(P)-dependent dehydrogenase (short-subunit alcohol dehydrogenase family)